MLCLSARPLSERVASSGTNGNRTIVVMHPGDRIGLFGLCRVSVLAGSVRIRGATLRPDVTGLSESECERARKSSDDGEERGFRVITTRYSGGVDIRTDPDEMNSLIGPQALHPLLEQLVSWASTAIEDRIFCSSIRTLHERVCWLYLFDSLMIAGCCCSVF